MRVDADTTVNDGRAKRQVPAVVPNAVTDLGGQFARGSQDEGAYPPPVFRTVLQTLQQGQGKSRRLAGARLGAREDVATFENKGDSLLLDRGRFLVTLFIDRTQQFGREAKLIK